MSLGKYLAFRCYYKALCLFDSLFYNSDHAIITIIKSILLRFILLTGEDDYSYDNDNAESLFRAVQNETADSAAMVTILDLSNYKGARLGLTSINQEAKLVAGFSKFINAHTIILPDGGSLEDILISIRSEFLSLPNLRTFVLKGEFTLPMNLVETLILHSITIIENEGSKNPSESFIELEKQFLENQTLEVEKYNASTKLHNEEEIFSVASEPRNYLLFGWSLNGWLTAGEQQDVAPKVEARQSFKR